MINDEIFLERIPKIYSFIVVRKESFGGYLFNPYFFEPLTVNHLGMRIIELCDGSRNVLEIIEEICDEFPMPFDYIKTTVTSALNAFNDHFAVNWIKERHEYRVGTNKQCEIIGNAEHLTAPLHVLWDITYACNLKCKHCLVSAGDQLENELSLKEVKEIINQLAEMKIFNLTFLGGEPLMRKDFLEILEYASKFSIGVTFSTNGYLIDEHVIEKLRQMDIFTVQVSLDGVEETHNRIRGVDSSFSRAVQAIKRLVDSGTRVGISTVVNKMNLNELDELVQLSISLGAISFKAIPFMPVGRGKEADYLTLTNEDMQQFVGDMVKRKKKYGDQIQINGEETYSWLLDKPPESSAISPVTNVSCVAGTRQIVISPTGLVFPCPFLHEFVAGDLRNETLSKIWNESKVLSIFREIQREDLKGKCGDCPYVPIHCRGGCRAAAFAYTGDLYEEDPMCWYQATRKNQ